jgi:glycosyltransferase involved in cell wall biosynthesis
MVAALPTIRELASASDRARGGRALLFFGIVRKYKGLEVLLRALPKVLSETDCHLVVAGEFYEPVDPYQQLIRSLGIEAHVRIDNRYIPNEEVPRILENADVLVLPYLSATQSGVARVAQASALPIIASRTGGLVETIIDGQTGLLFPPGDSDALADCIIKYFRDGLGREFAAALRLSEMSERSDLVAMFEAMATGAA